MTVMMPPRPMPAKLTITPKRVDGKGTPKVGDLGVLLAYAPPAATLTAPPGWELSHTYVGEGAPVKRWAWHRIYTQGAATIPILTCDEADGWTWAGVSWDDPPQPATGAGPTP